MFYDQGANRLKGLQNRINQSFYLWSSLFLLNTSYKAVQKQENKPIPDYSFSVQWHLFREACSRRVRISYSLPWVSSHSHFNYNLCYIAVIVFSSFKVSFFWTIYPNTIKSHLPLAMWFEIDFLLNLFVYIPTYTHIHIHTHPDTLQNGTILYTLILIYFLNGYIDV